MVQGHKVRIKDIAVKANVSVGTVDRVLHNRGEVSHETKELVFKVIEELGYKPNIIASNLASQKTVSLGIIMPEIHKDCISEHYIKGMKMAEEELSVYDLVVDYQYYNSTYLNSIEECFSYFNNKDVDALLILPNPSIKPYIDKFVETSEIPVFCFDNFVDNERINCLTNLHHDRSGALAAKLMSMVINRESTVVVVNIGDHPYHEERKNAFKNWYLENNITETSLRYLNIPATDDETIKKYINQALLDFSFVRGFFITSHLTYPVAAFMDEKKIGNMKIIGYDLNPLNAKYIANGRIDFVVTEDPFHIGKELIKNIFKHIYFKEEIRHQLFPVIPVTRENLPEFIF